MNPNKLASSQYTGLRKGNHSLIKPLIKFKPREDYLYNHIVNSWNNLDEEIINSPSVNTFKNKLDTLLANNNSVI